MNDEDIVVKSLFVGVLVKMGVYVVKFLLEIIEGDYFSIFKG